MPWTIRYHEQEPDSPQTGDMWPAPEYVEGDLAAYYRENLLSEEYFRDWHGKRPPLVVKLPNGRDLCIDRRSTGGGNGKWTVTGNPPDITMSPSINDTPGHRCGYHGYLTSGVLSDDVEGRTFPENAHAHS